MIFRRPFFLFAIFILAMFSRCGSNKSEIIKDYRITVRNGNEQQRDVFRKLSSKYNDLIGMKVLTYVETENEANSSISIVDGLEARDGSKIGYGQWISTTSEKGDCPFCPPNQETVTYTMKVEFDANYINTRIVKKDQASQDELWNLFCHEIGHGVTLVHTPNPADVMYKSVGGKKDYEAYAKQVRQAMGS